MHFESDRLLQADEQIGRVLAWEPGKRLLLEMFTWSFRSDEHTHVEVRFDAVATGMRVTVEHRGWERRPAGEAEFRTTVALGGVHCCNQLIRGRVQLRKSRQAMHIAESTTSMLAIRVVRSTS